MEFLLRKYRGNPDGGEQDAPTIEEMKAQYEAELEAEREKIRNQNSYITKLEEERNKLKETRKAAPTPPPVSSGNNAQPSAAERYAINKATQELIDDYQETLKEKYGEEVYNEFKEDFVAISRTNIKDPFNMPADLLQRAEQMAIGRAFGNEEKRVKIAGAYVIQEPNQKEPEPKGKEVVLDPGANKIGTLNPSDKQNLGAPNPNNPTNENRKMSRQEFLAQFQKNRR